MSEVRVWEPGATRSRARLTYAGLQLRVVAFILDCIVMLSFFALFFAAGGAQVLLRGGSDAPDSAIDVWIVIMLACAFPFAPVFFAWMWSWRGQSFGMMAVRIAITDGDGHMISFARAMVRTLLWPLSVLPLGVGLIPTFSDDRKRALHDMLSGTVVVELP